MPYVYGFDPNDVNYNPCSDGVRGCLLCVLASLDELESETEYVSNHPLDKETAEMLLLKIYSLKETLRHALYRGFFQ